jgi:hypothetical protein
MASQSAITRLPRPKAESRVHAGLYFNVAPKALSMSATQETRQHGSSADAQRASR